MKKLKIEQIEIDAGTQTRAAIHEDTVTDYAEAMTEGKKFPPVVVFYNGTHYFLADGFHRMMAAIRNGWKEIDADIRKGSRIDALKLSLGANTGHGLRRTILDKRRCVEIALKEFSKLTDPIIAKMCGVSQPFVLSIRKAQSITVIDSIPESSENTAKSTPPPPEKRIGHDGKSYPPSRPPALPASVTDPNGKLIPKGLIPLWNRGQEVQDMLTTLSQMRTAIERAQDEKDPLFSEMNYSHVIAGLENMRVAIAATKPYALCPICQGEGCRSCSGRGLIGKFRFDTCVPKEMKR